MARVSDAISKSKKKLPWIKQDVEFLVSVFSVYIYIDTDLIKWDNVEGNKIVATECSLSIKLLKLTDLRDFINDLLQP